MHDNDTPGNRPALTPATKLTTLGRKPRAYSGFVNTPIYRGSTVLFPDAETLRSGKIDYSYGRPSTPSARALETAITELEGGARTVLTPSGLSAITTVLTAFASAGAHMLITDSAYKPTRHFADLVLKSQGVEIEYYDPLIGGEIAKLFRPNTKLIWTESPGSLTFEIQDIPAICAAAKQAGIPVGIDNTWGTPLHFAALKHGVNISVHSATKYIIGHADALLGTITCDEQTAGKIAAVHYALGLCSNGEDCFLALRGLRTLGVRLAHHQRSALAIAQWLRERPEVAEVIHPALPGARGHDLWLRDFTGSCGLFSIILKPYSLEHINRMLNTFRLFGLGYSWGGFESLVIPFSCDGIRTATTWNAAGPALRFHVGLEDVDDLKADLANAFLALK